VSTQHSSRQAQAEQWGAEAKRLADSGHDVAAFDLYRKAADALPGAPWLQHKTAEMARKLKRDDLAITYFLRSASGFRNAGFAKRAVAPLRLAWSIARSGLPGSGPAFQQIADELGELFDSLGLAADAESIVEQSNEALRRAGLAPLQARHEAERPSRTSWYPTLRPQQA
jgi:hypothetical protein